LTVGQILVVLPVAQGVPNQVGQQVAGDLVHVGHLASSGPNHGREAIVEDFLVGPSAVDDHVLGEIHDPLLRGGDAGVKGGLAVGTVLFGGLDVGCPKGTNGLFHVVVEFHGNVQRHVFGFLVQFLVVRHAVFVFEHFFPNEF
jgi:hypothetical protein